MTARGGRRPGIARLRDEIRRTDEEILALIARRLQLARKVGDLKVRQGLPVQDFRVEKLVLERNRARAGDLGLPPEIADEVTRTLINYAVVAQDEDFRRAKRRPSGRADSVLIVGGGGGMGQWLARYFDSFGHAVAINDPRGTALPARFAPAEDLEAAALAHGIVVLATPIGVTAKLLRRICRTRTKALIFDICSLKSPLCGAIEAGLRGDLRIASVHPMFGPGASVLSGRNIVFCRTGARDHSGEARALFEATTARLISVPLRSHDRIMGYVLGLSHMVSLVFGRALAMSGFSAGDLRSFASTTFTAQAKVSELVAEENQDLYFEIQSQNAATPAVLEGFRSALTEFTEAVARNDRTRFKALMESARMFFAVGEGDERRGSGNRDQVGASKKQTAHRGPAAV